MTFALNSTPGVAEARFEDARTAKPKTLKNQIKVRILVFKQPGDADALSWVAGATLLLVSEQLKTARNIAIVVVIAAAVYFIPGGGRAANTFEAALWVAFAIGIGYLGLRLYREPRIAIHGLGDRHRALLYGGIVLAFFAYAAHGRMWETARRARLVPARGSCVR